MNKLFRFFSIIAFATLFMSFNVEAQIASKLQDTKVEDSFNIDVNFKEINKRLNKYQEKLKNLKVSSEETTEITQFINMTRTQLIDAKKVFEKELKFVQKRIDALGEGPKDGEKEVGVIAQKRKEFNDELNYQKGQIAESDVLLTRLDEVDNLILNIRSKALLGNLLERQEPLIYPTVFFHSTGLFVEYFYDIIHSPLDWYQNLNDVEKIYVKSNTLSTLFVIFLSLWVGVYLRLFIMRKFGYKKEFEHPRYGRKVFAAIFVAIAYGVIPASIIAGFLIWILSTKLLAVGFFGLVLQSFLYYSLYVVLARAVSRVLFAPYNEKWRIVNVSTEKAKRVTSALYLSALVIGISSFFEHVADNANYPILLSSYITSMSCAIKAFCIVLIVKRLLWDGIDDDEKEDDLEDDSETEVDDSSVNIAFRVTFFISFFSLSVFILSLSGYPFLSSFILNRFILSFLLIGLLIIIRKAFEEILHRLLLLRFWVKTFKLRRKIISKINFWLSLVVDPLFVLAGLFLVLALWGVSTDLLRQFISKMFFGFTVGGIKISLISIVFGILIFFIGVSFIKALKKRLMNNVLSKMDIDDGIKHSLEAGFGSLGFVLSALLAIAVMGGDLTNFALIAGALSFGVGLGLQNVVNNFVSGIILLFERPIKVGDWVIVNGQEGVVKQINIRATELETWKKASIIIPNADLLSTTVTNLTHNDSWGRLDIGVGVAYGSDTRKVAEVLLEAAESQKKVLKKPAPYVIFKNFGESTLDFELRCFTADIMGGLGVSSEIRFEIDRLFREAHIEIPFPQRTLHLGDAITRKSLNNMLEPVNKKG